jgi:hypothetical protein
MQNKTEEKLGRRGQQLGRDQGPAQSRQGGVQNRPVHPQPQRRDQAEPAQGNKVPLPAAENIAVAEGIDGDRPRQGPEE